MLQLTFNPALTLTGFRTTRPWWNVRAKIQSPGFLIPYEVDSEFVFDENAESERLAKLQNTWLKDFPSRFPYSAWFTQIFRSTTVEYLDLLGLLLLNWDGRCTISAPYLFRFRSVHTFGCIKTFKVCGAIYNSLEIEIKLLDVWQT